MLRYGFLGFLGGFCGRGLFWFLWEGPVFCLFFFGLVGSSGLFCRHHVVLVIFGRGGCAVVREYMEIMAGALYIDWTGCWL